MSDITSKKQDKFKAAAKQEFSDSKKTMDLQAALSFRDEMIAKMKQKEQESKDSETESVKPKSLKSLKELIFLGTRSRDIEIGGFKFTISSLSSKENRNLISKSFLLFQDDKERLAGLNQLMLAASLKRVNDVEIYEVYDELFEGEDAPNLADTFDRSLYIINRLSISVVNKLFQEFTEMTLEIKNELDSSNSGEDIKK